MDLPDTLTTSAADFFEREKWEADCAFREREILIKERECNFNEADFNIRKAEHADSHWKNPLVVAILAAAMAAVGNAAVVFVNADSQITLEAQKSEQARILEMIKTGSPDKAAENLQFLLNAGLILDPTVHKNIVKFLENRKPGTGPALPSSTISKDMASLMSKFEGTMLQPYKKLGDMLIGTGHLLTADELASGMLIINGKPVDFRAGITPEQAAHLLDQDLRPIREEIQKLVTVKLTSNQVDALASLASQIGMGAFKKSTLLKKLNSEKYDEIPEEMMRWAKIHGSTTLDLLDRRNAEITLWAKP